MFELSDFYDYCKKNNVMILPFEGMPAPGATLHDRGKYAIFLDFSQIPTTRVLRGVCCHEMSHVATGSGFLRNSQNENTDCSLSSALPGFIVVRR